ncbi:uncharacterized protein DUF4251 [Mucilaginibacter gracilis]|uniref:Uncharacterized protein DUF4251 n=1 Tax=Mucilaginibacter gracilis TaxID=423350 RepID=A0A495JAJ8_9SPHI|nr:DUF4251 domain-containing protein [Mucilaginibacter gracilis]RKR85741.1 uncharacterized protein DUF4251 [Mucilaginibacter gracilis]
MKAFIVKWASPAFFVVLSVFVWNLGFAQSTKKEKQAKAEAEMKSIIDAQNYVFKAQYVQPMRGGNKYITPDYDLRISKDSVISYLPYFGRAYVAPFDPQDAGMMFTATEFDYKVVENKNGWDVSIKPVNTKDVRYMRLSVSKDGYATLQITSNNRDAISYQGYIEVKKHKV